jgi:hypothetical protein
MTIIQIYEKGRENPPPFEILLESKEKEKGNFSAFFK